MRIFILFVPKTKSLFYVTKPFLSMSIQEQGVATNKT